MDGVPPEALPSFRRMTDRFVVRDLEVTDLNRQVELLQQLTKVSPLSDEQVREIFYCRKKAGIVSKVVEDKTTGLVVGTAALLVERKYSHGGRSVGHIEDVVSDQVYRGQGVGRLLVEALCRAAEDLDCYKVILDCHDNFVNFYSRYGFKKTENQMRIDLPREN